MNYHFFSRRKFISKLMGTSALLVVGGALGEGCVPKKIPDKENSGAGTGAVDACNDLSDVSETDIALRQQLAYVAESPIADNHCNNCNLYLPAKANQPCGGCMLFKGPVYPSGYCTYWAPKI